MAGFTAHCFEVIICLKIAVLLKGLHNVYLLSPLTECDESLYCDILHVYYQDY
jgi:hypothetical protein